MRGREGDVEVEDVVCWWMLVGVDMPEVVVRVEEVYLHGVVWVRRRIWWQLCWEQGGSK